MKIAYLSLGSNVGERETHLLNAIQKLAQLEFVEILKVSAFYETNAVARYSQPNYLNAAMKIRTILTPDELLTATQKIEIELGRTSKQNEAPRTIDIDILLYEQELICTDELTIPHPLLHLRPFVLIPLQEIAPSEIHPILQESIMDIYQRVVGY